MTRIASGEHHTLALTSAGGVLSFGRPTYGRLGRAGVNVASDDSEHTPEPVLGFTNEPVVCIAAGVAVSAAIAESGAMYMWGYGDTGMLGKGPDDSDEVAPRRLAPSKRFPAVGGISVSLGGQHAAWLSKPLADALVADAPSAKVQRRT